MRPEDCIAGSVILDKQIVLPTNNISRVEALKRVCALSMGIADTATTSQTWMWDPNNEAQVLLSQRSAHGKSIALKRIISPHKILTQERIRSARCFVCRFLIRIWFQTGFNLRNWSTGIHTFYMGTKQLGLAFQCSNLLVLQCLRCPRFSLDKQTFPDEFGTRCE